MTLNKILRYKHTFVIIKYKIKYILILLFDRFHLQFVFSTALVIILLMFNLVVIYLQLVAPTF